MGSAFVRVAVAQLDYHPALFARFRSPIEDPGGATPLLPAIDEIPEDARRRFAGSSGPMTSKSCAGVLFSWR
jgi:hypothetical protein